MFMLDIVNINKNNDLTDCKFASDKMNSKKS
ncbi:MAG: hypothetical protein RLY35_171 [Bacteroidota bacterium]|jgi:hypothetical protein